MPANNQDIRIINEGVDGARQEWIRVRYGNWIRADLDAGIRRRTAESTVAERRRTDEFISQLRNENEKSTDRSHKFSRACGVCLTEVPTRRAVFSACGHVVCRACAEQMKADASDENRSLTCPFCRKESRFVPLFEDQIVDENNVEERKVETVVKRIEKQADFYCFECDQLYFCNDLDTTKIRKCPNCKRPLEGLYDTTGELI